jgi:PAS domain S-box-containing protein
MIFVTLLNNIALLVALSYVQSLIIRRWSPKTAAYRLCSGLLFGGVAVAGMMAPLDFGDGGIFDGRSIVISVAGLFGGPVPAILAAAIAASYRIVLGGGGVAMGLLVITESALVGLAFRWLRRRYPRQATHPLALLAFGLLVHLLMLLSTTLLPAQVRAPVLREIWLFVLTLYPLATVLLCWIFIDQEVRIVAEQALQASEERYRGLVESSIDHIFMLDAEGRVLTSNGRTEHVGVPPGISVVGRLLEEIYDPEVAALYRSYLQQALATRQAVRFEHRVGLATDGRIHSDVLFPILVGSEVVGIGGVCHDITARIQAQESLRVALAKYQALFGSFPLGILVVDPAGIVLETNEIAGELFGIGVGDRESCSRPILRPDGTLMPDEEMACRRALVEQRLVRDVEMGIQRPEGEITWVSATATPLPVAGYGAVATFMDVTARKRDEQERLDLERQLLHSQKMESLGVLAGGVAHDFNNLLAAILGNLDLALLDLDEVSPVRPLVADAMQATRRAADLTRQMLAYSGKGRFIVSALDLSDLVRENAHILRTAIARTATLALNLAPSVPPIAADAGQIQQVVMNLITNASEALQEAPGTVSLSTGMADCDARELAHSLIEEKPAPGRYVWLEVADSGCGMDAETRSRIFEPFFSTKAAGRGLGMAAILGIVRGHRGAIMIDSSPGQGTRVRVMFPAADIAVMPDWAASSQGELPSPASGPADPSIRLGTILVVDDEEMILRLSRQLVNRLGYDVLTAADGEEALRVFQHHGERIVCVLLDLTIPKLDGISTLAELRRLRPGIPVILCSGYSEQTAARRLSQAEPSGFIQKPYRLGDLQAELERVLSRPR